MLTNLIANFCNTVLGRYFENLDTNQLSFSLLQGKAELRNLSLKKNALANLGLPISIHSGFVGKVTLDIPLTQMTSRPWVILLEQLYLVAGPKNMNESETKESPEVDDEEHKQAALDLMEAEWRSEIGFQGLTSFVYSSTCSTWVRHGTSLLTNVVQNIELKVKDVHIRFEDVDVSSPEKKIAFGFNFQSFTAQTCDDQWKPSNCMASAHEMFKLVELGAFSVYWDTNIETYRNLPLIDLRKKMKHSGTERHEFILMPSNLRVHLKQNCSATSLQSLNQPRIVCDLLIDRLEVEVRHAQYVQCCKVLENLSQFGRHKFKPRRQWKFAGDCIIAEIKKKRKVENWPFVIQRSREIIMYVRYYKEHLTNPTRSAVIKLELDRMESDFELEELLVLRSISMLQISKEKNFFRRWYNDFLSWWSTEDHWNQFKKAHSVREKKPEHEILEMLIKARRESMIRKEDMLSIHLIFTLKNGCFRLSSSPKTETTSAPSNTLLVQYSTQVARKIQAVNVGLLLMGCMSSLPVAAARPVGDLDPKLVTVDIEAFTAEISSIVSNYELPWIEGTFGLVLLAVAKYWGGPLMKYLWGKIKDKWNNNRNKPQHDDIPLSPPETAAMEELLRQQLAVLINIEETVASMEAPLNDPIPMPQEFGQPRGGGDQ